MVSGREMLKKLHFLIVSFSIFCFLTPLKSAIADIASKVYVDDSLVAKVNTADLATEIASAITGKEDVSNKVSDLSASFTDNTQYPSALAVKNALANKVDITAGTNQTLSGTYTVAGTLSVNTPTLPAS